MSKRKFKYEKYKYSFEKKEPLFYWTVSDGRIDGLKYDLLFKKYNYYNQSKNTRDDFEQCTTRIRYMDFIDTTK